MTMGGLVDDILHRQPNNDNRRQSKLTKWRKTTYVTQIPSPQVLSEETVIIQREIIFKETLRKRKVDQVSFCQYAKEECLD